MQALPAAATWVLKPCSEKLMEAAQPTEFFEPEHYFV